MICRLDRPRHAAAFAVVAAAFLTSAPGQAQPAATGTATATTSTSAAPAGAAAVIEGVKKAAAAYASSFNAGDEKALALQWTAGAELEEGAGLIKGRDTIVASLMNWRKSHPQATLAIDVTDVQPLGVGAARVRGTLTFTGQPGQEPLSSRFESLRVLEDGAWKIAESRVVPSPRAAIAGLSWLVGSWQSADPKTGTTIDANYERSLAGNALVGRIKTKRKDGSTSEAIDLIHADRLTGAVRSTVVDSTGAQAEGILSTDGTSFNRSFVGTPGDPAIGDHAEWVQVLAPLGPDKILWHTIERKIDGRSVPNTDPVHFRRVR
jgi:hypothetical protein